MGSLTAGLLRSENTRMLLKLTLLCLVGSAFGGVPVCQVSYKQQCRTEPRNHCTSVQKPHTTTTYEQQCRTEYDQKCDTVHDSKVEYVDRQECRDIQVPRIDSVPEE